MDASSWEAQPAAKQCLSSEASPGFLPPGLASTGTATEVIRVHQSLEDSHPLSVLQALFSAPAANSICSWAHCN